MSVLATYCLLNQSYHDAARDRDQPVENEDDEPPNHAPRSHDLPESSHRRWPPSTDE